VSTYPIRGVLPVIQLPYHDDYSIDHLTLQREIDWVFAQGPTESPWRSARN